MVTFKIQETFQETIQGEGFWAGTPCDFIRLYGCPVGCSWCDTGYSTIETAEHLPKSDRTLNQLIEELKSNFVVISGGEPFAQQNLSILVDEIVETDRYVAIETSGAFYQDIQNAWITLSPKQHESSNYPVHKDMWSLASEIKIVISRPSDLDFYIDILQSLDALIFLQPEWSKKKTTIPLVLEMIKKYGYRLSLQTHKLIGVK